MNFEVSPKHGCHCLSLRSFGFLSDSDNTERFELRLRFRPFLFADAAEYWFWQLGVIRPVSVEFMSRVPYIVKGESQKVSLNKVLASGLMISGALAPSKRMPKY